MISVIICSINPDLLKKVRVNIRETIGCEYELLAHDNRVENLGICAVYNRQAGKAKYPHLCFVHEDVFFHSENWGEELNTALSDKSVGVVGLVGTTFKSEIPAPWSACDSSFYRGSGIVDFGGGPVTYHYNPDSERFSEVIVADGVFLASTKTFWEQHPFDKNLLKGFHGYDIEWSLQAAKTSKVVVLQNVLQEHFSTGSHNLNSLYDTYRVHQKHRYLLSHISKSNNVKKVVALDTMVGLYWHNWKSGNKATRLFFVYLFRWPVPFLRISLYIFIHKIWRIIKTIKPAGSTKTCN